MLNRTLSSVSKRAAICYNNCGFRFCPAVLPSLSSTTIPLTHHVHQFSTTPSLQSPSDENDTNEDKKEMIQKWMKQNRAKTWHYKPNLDLIAKIGKEGSTSTLDQFRDLVPTEKRQTERVGRSWSVKELRRKSYEDLHKLWYVLYKEKNMLLTETNLARRHGYDMLQPDRRRKVQKSMGAIKHVLGERKLKKINEHKEYLAQVEKFEDLMADMKLDSDTMEDSMNSEAEKLSSS